MIESLTVLEMMAFENKIRGKSCYRAVFHVDSYYTSFLELVDKFDGAWTILPSTECKYMIVYIMENDWLFHLLLPVKLEKVNWA